MTRPAAEAAIGFVCAVVAWAAAQALAGEPALPNELPATVYHTDDPVQP